VSWRIAAVVSLGGWYTMVVSVCCEVVTKHVGPEEYILGTLFILCPEALPFLASTEQHPTDASGGGDETETERTEEQYQYGAI